MSKEDHQLNARPSITIEPNSDPVTAAIVIVTAAAKRSLSKDEKRHLMYDFESCLSNARRELHERLTRITKLPPEQRIRLSEEYGRLYAELAAAVRTVLLTGDIDMPNMHDLVELDENLRHRLGLAHDIQTKAWAKDFAERLVGTSKRRIQRGHNIRSEELNEKNAVPYRVVVDRNKVNVGQIVRLLQDIANDATRRGVACKPRTFRSIKTWLRKAGYTNLLEHLDYNKETEKVKTTLPAGALIVQIKEKS